MGWLRTIGAADLTISSGGGVDHSGFEVRRYDYQFNERGKRFAEKTARRYADLWARLKSVADNLMRAGDLDYVKMSIAAKTYSVFQETNGKVNEQDLARLARPVRLGSHAAAGPRRGFRTSKTLASPSSQRAECSPYGN